MKFHTLYLAWHSNGHIDGDVKVEELMEIEESTDRICYSFMFQQLLQDPQNTANHLN